MWREARGRKQELMRQKRRRAQVTPLNDLGVNEARKLEREKRKIRGNGSDERQGIHAEDEMTSADRRRKEWKPRDERERERGRQRSIERWTARGGWIRVTYVERQEVPRVFVSRRNSRRDAREGERIQRSM